MSFHRNIAATLCVLLTGLSGCASLPHTAAPASKQPVSPQTASAAPQSLDSSAPQPEVHGQASDLDSDVVDQPVLIRGDDRMFNPPSARPAVTLPGGEVTLRFEQAPVTEVVHAVLGDILQLPYAINQPVAGTITLHTHSPLPRDQIFPVFEAALQANGLLIARDAAGVFHVGKPETLRGVAPLLNGVGTLPAGHSMVIVPLQFIGASEMAEILGPLAPPEAFVRIDGFRNLLILAGTRSQLDGWLEIINTFDIDLLKGMSVGLFPLNNTSVREVEAGLKAVLAGVGTVPTPSAQTKAGRAGGRSGASADLHNQAESAGSLQLPAPLVGVIRVVAIERLNALLIITPRAHYLETARLWIEKFDQPRTGGNEARLFVYPVQNGTAQHLAGLLNAIFGGEQSSAGQPAQQRSVAPGLGAVALSTGQGSASAAAMQQRAAAATAQGGSAPTTEIAQVQLANQVRVVADERNNALLIHAPQAEYRKIETALRRLDVAPTQVLIEATILEVTLTDELKYGLQWYFNGALGSGDWRGSGQLTAGSTDAIATTNPGFSYSITNPLGQIRAVLNALAKKSRLNVISSPSVMVLDNHTAFIQVGDQQPVRSAETITDGGTRSTSIQYKDTGVSLAVSPSVNAGGMVTMTIEQAVTDVGPVDAATGQRSFLQRQLSSRVAVRSGETLVLGGLIRDNDTRDRQGVPWLHDIPVFGNLFGATANTSIRTELLVMLTPRVVANEGQLREVGAELRQRMRGLDQLPERIATDFGIAPAPSATRPAE